MEGSRPDDLRRQWEEYEAENRGLRDQLEQAEEEIDRLRQENEQLRKELKAAGRGSRHGSEDRKRIPSDRAARWDKARLRSGRLPLGRGRGVSRPLPCP